MSEFSREELSREKGEENSQKWLEEYYQFDESNVDEDALKKIFVDYDERNRERWEKEKQGERDYEKWVEEKRKSGGKKRKMPELNPPLIRLLRDKPDLTLEEMKEGNFAYGDTNNFWQWFVPGMHERIQESLSDNFRMDYFAKYVYVELKKGRLMEAFQRVGFERSKQMILAIERYKKIGSKSGVAPPDMRVPWVTDDDRKEFSAARLEFSNILRHLAVVLYDLGVSLGAIHG